MTSQLLFGECMEVLEAQEDWIRIRTRHDGYEGWLTPHLVAELPLDTVLAPGPFVTTGLLNPLTLPNELVNLPMGAQLTGYDPETRLLWDGEHKYHGTFRDTTVPADTDLFWRTVHPWLNAPYLWGGRTFLGVDCSGFVQVVYRILGVPLLRDAWQQAGEGRVVETLEEVRTGDLAFFASDQGRVVHVGILLGDGKIMHAAGKVRVDPIDAEGITHKQTGRRTHRLCGLRRVLPEGL
jgi:hypothetical protein